MTDISRFTTTVLDQRAYQPHQGLGPSNKLFFHWTNSEPTPLIGMSSTYGNQIVNEDAKGAGGLFNKTARLTVRPFWTISFAHDNTTAGGYLA